MNTSLNQQQRKDFERALQEARDKANRILSAKRNEAESIALDEVLKKTDGAWGLATTATRLRSELDAAEEKLEALGFELGRDGVELAYRAPDALRELYNVTIEKHVAAEAQRVEAISAAIRNAWTISTLPEAMKTVQKFA